MAHHDRGEQEIHHVPPAHAKHIFDEESNAFADLHDPDLVKFPNFHRAVPLEFDLRAGETVYIPRGWPHYAGD